MSLERVRSWGRDALRPVVILLARSGINPNVLTVFGVILSIGAAGLLAFGYFRWAAIVMVIAGLWDVLDGGVARQTGQVTRFGALLDSSVDRASDIALYGGFLIYYAHLRPAVSLLILSALAGSYLTSYVRARAEGLGFDCRVGLLQRPERVVLLILGALSGPRFCILFIAVIALLSWITVIQRVHHVWVESVSRSSARNDHGEEKANA